jgi:hypothetical protein
MIGRTNLHPVSYEEIETRLAQKVSKQLKSEKDKTDFKQRIKDGNPTLSDIQMADQIV